MPLDLAKVRPSTRAAAFGLLAASPSLLDLFAGAGSALLLSIHFVAAVALFALSRELLRSPSQRLAPRLNACMFLLLGAALLSSALLASPVPQWLGSAKPWRGAALIGLASLAALSGVGFALTAGRDPGPPSPA